MEIQDETYGSTGTLDYHTFSKLYTPIAQEPIKPAIEETPETTVGNTPNTAEQGQPPQASEPTTTIPAGKKLTSPTPQQRAAVGKWYVKQGNGSGDPQYQRNGYYVDGEGRKVFNNRNQTMLRINDLDEETSDPSFGKYDIDTAMAKRHAGAFDRIKQSNSISLPFNSKLIEALQKTQAFKNDNIIKSPYQVTKVGNSYYNTEYLRDAIVALGGINEVSLKIEPSLPQDGVLLLESKHGDAIIGSLLLSEYERVDLDKFYGKDIARNTPKSTPGATTTNEVEKEDNLTEGNKDVPKNELKRPVQDGTADQNQGTDPQKEEKYPVGFTYQDTNYEGDTINKKVVGRSKAGEYYVQEEGRGEADIFAPDRMEQELKYAPDRIKRAQAYKIQKQKDDEAKAKAAEDKKEYERLNQFADNMTPMQRGRVNAALNKKFRYNGKVMSRREFIEEAVKGHKAYVKMYERDKGNEYALYQDKDARYYSQITKTEYDYFNYLTDSGTFDTTEMLEEYANNNSNTLDKPEDNNIIRQDNNTNDTKAGEDSGNVSGSNSTGNDESLEDVLPEGVGESGLPGNTHGSIQTGRKDPKRNGQNQENSTRNERPGSVDRNDGAVLHNPVSPGNTNNIEGTQSDTGRDQADERRGETGERIPVEQTDNTSALENTATIADGEDDIKGGAKPSGIAGENPGNFVITEDLGLGEGTDGDKIKLNLQALRTLMQLRKDKRYPTKEEQAAMARYVGWGGLARVFDSKESESNNMYGKAQRELKEILTKDEFNTARSTVTDAHYTSKGVVDAMWRIVRHLGFNGGRALEPTVGIGNFIGLQPTELNAMTKWYASEIDTVSGEMASYLYPDATVLHSTGFQDAPFANGVFDLAIGNPPFGSMTLTSKGKKYKELAGMKIHNFIIAKTGEHLRPGGVMSMVVTHRFLDTANAEARDYLADRFKFIGALRLPNDAFVKNAGTEVVTDIIILQKLNIGEKADKNASWLDVNGSIDVNGEKIRVNKYFEEHPNHILGRSAMDGSMYARSSKAGTEYTVHSDGRDVGKSIDSIIASDFADFAGILKPTKADQNFAAAMVNQSTLAINGMMLDENGKIMRREEDDDNGNAVVNEVTPDTIWSEDGYRWKYLIDQLKEIKLAAKRKTFTMDMWSQFDSEAKAFYKADGSRKSSPNKAEESVYKINAAMASEQENFVWKYDADLAEINQALGRNILNEKRYNKLRGLLDLRNRVLALNNAEMSDAKNIEQLRKELNKVYDSFVKRFGFVSDPATLKLLGWDIGAEAGLENDFKRGVSATSAKNKGTVQRPPTANKADILSRRINYPVKEITHADSSLDALKISLSERGRADIAYMAKLTGKQAEDIIKDLSQGEHPQIFMDPEINDYVHADEYLSGNVKKKLDDAKVSSGLEANVKALEAVQPKPKKQEQITPNIRASWIPSSIFEEFLSALGIAAPRVSISRTTGKIIARAKFSVTDDSLTDFGMQFNNKHHNVVNIFNAATAGKTLNAYTEDEHGNRIVAAEPTKVVNGLVDRMGQVFERWAYSSDSKAKKIVGAFNEEMNTFVPRKYDGVHYLKPVGVSPSISLRNTQKDAAWRMIQAPTVLLDHVVGAGKTFTIITGVMERKRLGLSNKPLIVVPNHLITQWAKSFYELYPNAKILAASPDDFTRKRRRALFSRIATSDYDAIVIGHSSMGFIPAPAADQKLVIDEQIELLKDAMEEARDAGNNRSVKDMEKKLKTLQDKLANLAARTTDDIGYDLETMGIDYVAVDESHEFKNLAYTTAAPRVVGMNDPVGSKKAFDLNIKVRGVLSRKGSVTFATGTPVSNSLVELYTVMQYLAHDELVERNQLNFDAWAGAYTRVETKIEYTPTQKVKPRRVLASVNNLSALRQLYDHFADIITIADIKRLYKEEIEAKNKANGTHERTEFPVPKVKSGGRILDTGPIGETQSEYMDYAVARMNAMEQLHGAEKKAYASIDNALWVMNDVRQMSLDIRTIDPSLPREDSSKVNRAADNIKKIYDQWNEQRGTQLVFCDLSTPSKNAAKNAKKIISEATEKLFPDKYGKKRFLDSISYMSYRDQWTKILDVYTEKMESDALSEDEADALSEYFDAIDEDASTSMIVADSGFSVYDDLKKVLEQKGIPSNEIAFIHDYDTPAKKSELFDRMNDGYVRVLIGSSAKMGAGMNAQERLVALHHMDPPWRPSDMWQREGRIIRQGNKLYEADPDGFEVSIIAYTTSGTSDTVMWQILQRKANAIEQFRQGDDIDAIEEESSDADQYADFMATSTGNPVFKKKVEAERKLDLIESEIGGVLLSRQGAAEFLKEYPSSKRNLEDTIAKLNSKTIDPTDVAAYKELEHRVASEEAAARGRYLTQKAEVQEAIAKWEKSDAKTRGKKPTMPVPPERADILHPVMQKESQYARSIKDGLEKMYASNAKDGTSFSVPLGGNSTAQLTISREKYWASDKNPQWTAKITYGNNKGNGNVYYADAVLISKSYASNPLDAYTFIASLSMTNVVDEYNYAKEGNANSLKELNEQYVRSKEILAQEINTDTLDEAKRIKEWYMMQVKFAEREADIKRSGRRNRFIENERKGRNVKQSQVKAFDAETIEVDGETYTTNGISYENSHIQDVLKATRDKDNLPVVILKTTDMSKQDKASSDVIVDYHVIEQPQSLKGESYSLEDRTNVLKDIPKVTAASLSGSVPGAQVSETKNGLIKVRFKNGFTMFVDPASEEIAIDPEIVKRDYGRDVSAEDIAVGRNYVTSGIGFIDLVGGMTDVESFDHEYYEVARKMVVQAEDLAILEQDFKQTEDESRAFSDFMKDRRGKLTKRTSRIFQKIKDFFAKIRAKLFGRRSEDIFRDIATGKVWGNKQGVTTREMTYKINNSLDAKYMEAVKAMDTATLRSMVDKAAKASGFTIRAFHGTPTGGFTEFNRDYQGRTGGRSRGGFSFTTNRDVAEMYADNFTDETTALDESIRIANGALRSLYGNEKAISIFEGQLGYDSDENPIPEFYWGVIDDQEDFAHELNRISRALKKDFPEQSEKLKEASETLSSFASNPEVKEVFLKIPDNAKQFKATPDTLGDVVSMLNVREEPSGAAVVNMSDGEKVFYVESPNNIKSAEMITYDKSGKVIPLSDRFNTSKSDIRYRIIRPSESYLVKQEISSAKTARPGQIPRGFKLIKWRPGTVNFDIGGGRDNEGTEYLKGQGVDSFVYDLYNRDPAHNRKSVERIIEHKVDTVTVMNVLNVIKEPEIRDNTILQAAKSLKKGGVAYFQIYEGSKDGVGKVTSAGWQNNMKTVDYVGEIQKRFNDVVRHGQIIEGRDPKPFKDKATWILDGDKAQETISYRIIRPSEAKKQQKADPAEKVKYETPVYQKDVSAKGRTKQEQTAWAQIADDLGLERVVEKRSPHLSLKERMVKAKHYIEDQWFNQEAPIRRYLGQDIFMMTRNAFDGVDSRAQALIEFGEKAEGIKSLKEIFKPVKGSKSEQQGFMHYAVYKHYVDIAQRSEDAEFAVHVLEQQAKEEDANARQLRKDMPFDRKDKKELESAARGCERYADELRAKANAERTKIKNSKADASKYQAAVDELEKQYPEWKSMQKDLAKFNNYILKKYADAGIIPKSLYEYLSTNLPNYVPFQRDFGDDSRIDTFIRTKGLVSLKNPLEKMTGSQRDILDPMDEILNHVYEMESLTAKQKVALALVDKVNEGELGDLVKRTENKTSGPGRYVFYVWRNGEKKYYSTEDKGLYYAIAMTNPAANMTDFEKLLSVPASILRSLTTNSIGFAWKNPIRDTFQAGVYGKGFIPVKSTLDGIVSILKNDDAYVDYLKHGGAQGLASISNAKRKDIKDDVRGNKTHNPAKVLWNALKRINFLTEQGTRVGQYKAAIKLGYSKDEAAFIQRDLMNFLQGGYSSKRLNAQAVFFNAGMQDLYKLYNAHIHDGALDTATVRKAITWITIPSMLFWAWNNGDDDRKKIWNEMETWKKNLFWWIIIDKDFSIPFPKPFSLGLLYGSIPERFMDYWLNDDKRTAERFATTLTKQMLPSAIPLYAALLMEYWQNRSLFFDRDIVPVSEQHLDKSMQYGTYTSEWAKWVGKNIPGVSPRMLEHTVYGVTGNLGREVSGVVNDIWRGVSGETRPAKAMFEYFPGSSSFIRNNRTFRISVDRWFDDSKRLEGELDSAKKMREEGYASMTDKQKAVLNAEGQIRGILHMNTARGGIYSLMRQKNDIAESKTMTATEKRDAIDRIDAHIVSMAQLGLKRVKQYDDAVEQMEEMMEARREEKK